MPYSGTFENSSLDLTFVGRFLPSSTLRQSSSVVEQRTHKPLVGSSNLPFGTILRLKPSDSSGGFFRFGALVGQL